MAVMTPTGISIGARAVRATRSARIKKTAPLKRDRGRRMR